MGGCGESCSCHPSQTKSPVIRVGQLEDYGSASGLVAEEPLAALYFARHCVIVGILLEALRYHGVKVDESDCGEGNVKRADKRIHTRDVP